MSDNQVYYKITNRRENHHGFQYRDGLNILIEPFQEIGSCVPGGFYFTTAQHIFKYISYGVYLREIYLPKENSEFKMVKDPQGDKWRANQIYFGNKYKLCRLETFRMMDKLGVDFKTCNNELIVWASYYNHLGILKFLVKKGCDPSINNNYAIKTAAELGHYGMVKYLVEQGVDYHCDNDYAIRMSASNGHFNIVKYLIDRQIPTDIVLKNQFN
nr:ankyrin repeat domain containing protein [Mimivirus sp.]